MNERLKISLGVLALLSIVICVYWPGMSGGFMFDDYPNILGNDAVSNAKLTVEDLKAAVHSGIAGPLKRPIPMLSFALNSATAGIKPAAFKITNLLIHLLVGLLVFYLTLLILRQTQQPIDRLNIGLASLFGAAFWMLHPINLSTTLYVVQRMNSLAAMFSLLAIIFYCVGRRRLIDGEPRAFFYCCVITPIAILMGLFCKENAIVVIPIIALTELCFFRFEAKRESHISALKTTYMIGAVLSVVLVLAFLWLRWDWLDNRYQFMAFSLMERLLTETRVLCYYAALIVFPRLTEFALFHDDFIISSSLFNPISTLACVLALAAVISAIPFLAKRFPLLTYSIGWFLLAHSLEASFLPLDIIYEHRNYLPAVGIAVGVAGALTNALAWGLEKRLVFTITAMIISVLAGLTFLRANSWSDPVTLAMVEAQNHPKSFRSVYAAGRAQYGLYLMRKTPSDYIDAVEKLERAINLDLDSKLPLIGLIQLAYNNGEQPKAFWLEELKDRFQSKTSRIADINALGAIARCRADKVNCKIPGDLVVEIYEVAHTSEKMKSAVKAQLLVDFAALLINERQANERALQLLYEANSKIPNNYAYRRILIDVLISSGKTQEAMSVIESAREIDRWKDRYNSPITELDALATMIGEQAPKPVDIAE